MSSFNKLVRDKIPAIIRQSGSQPIVRTLDSVEYESALKTKLMEEAREFLAASDTNSAKEELADILEVMFALYEVLESSPEEIESLRKQKREERGGFRDRVFLIEVLDE